MSAIVSQSPSQRIRKSKIAAHASLSQIHLSKNMTPDGNRPAQHSQQTKTVGHPALRRISIRNSLCRSVGALPNPLAGADEPGYTGAARARQHPTSHFYDGRAPATVGQDPRSGARRSHALPAQCHGPARRGRGRSRLSTADCAIPAALGRNPGGGRIHRIFTRLPHAYGMRGSLIEGASAPASQRVPLRHRT